MVVQLKLSFFSKFCSTNCSFNKNEKFGTKKSYFEKIRSFSKKIKRYFQIRSNDLKSFVYFLFVLKKNDNILFLWTIHFVRFFSERHPFPRKILFVKNDAHLYPPFSHCFKVRMLKSSNNGRKTETVYVNLTFTIVIFLIPSFLCFLSFQVRQHFKNINVCVLEKV